MVGCDEAGRGPLAGPVVAAAVVFCDCEAIWSCRDSKSIGSSMRDELFSKVSLSLIHAVARVEPEEIDEVNIRVASLLAMTRAVELLNVEPEVVLVDGRDRLPQIPESRAIVHGDAKVATISAASILAKVTRDRIMREYHEVYPHYGFFHNFGYPTELHRKAIQKFGPCPIHRRSFRGVREYLEFFQQG